MRSIITLPVSFVPFDAGGWSERCPGLIEGYVNARARLRMGVRHDKERILVGEETSQFLTTDEHGRTFIFDVFHDGFGVATVVDQRTMMPLDRLDPSKFLESRRALHIGILEKRNPISDIVQEHVSGIRKILGASLKLRPTSSNSWRRTGLAYVFTIYFLEITSDESPGCSSNPFMTVTLLKEDSDLRHKLLLMLEPSILGIIDTPSFETLASDLSSIFTQKGDEVPESCDSLACYCTCVSWSTALIMGPINQTIMDDYIFLEKRLQHCWFKVLCLGDAIEFGQEQHGRRSQRAIEALLFEVKRQLPSVRGVAEPSIGKRYLNILTKLIETSLLEQQIARVQDHLQIISARLEADEARGRRRYQRVVEALLFVFAFSQAVSIFIMLDLIGNPYVLAALGCAFVGGLVLLRRT